MKEAFFDTPLYREFAQLEVFARLFDESTILRSGHRLEKHKPAEQILATVNDLLIQRGLLLKKNRGGRQPDSCAQLHQEQRHGP